jgi:hypothetical protein
VDDRKRGADSGHEPEPDAQQLVQSKRQLNRRAPRTRESDRAYQLLTDRLAEGTRRRPSSTKGLWLCPAHDDKNPSLSVTKVAGTVLIHCFAGCRPEDVLSALGLTLQDLYDSARGTGNPPIPPTYYGYRDEGRSLQYKVVRLYPKRFIQRRPNGSGGWIWNLKNVRRVLYRLPEVLEAITLGEPIFICEGEKDADAVVRAGECATTSPMGAGKWRPEYSEMLRGASDVYVVADNDHAGQLHAHDVVRSLAEVGIVAPVIHPIEGKDVSDHLAAGRTLDELTEIVLEDFSDVGDDEAMVSAPPTEFRRDLIVEDLRDVLDRVRNGPKRRWLFRGVWAEGDYGMFSGPDKAGKSWAVLDAAISMASGTPWLGHFEVESPGPVLMFLGEGGERKVVRRLEAIARTRGVLLDDLRIRVCFRVPHLTNGAHMLIIQEEIQTFRPQLVIIDPLYLAARGARGSDLFEMGANLEGIQVIAQAVDAGSCCRITTRKAQASRRGVRSGCPASVRALGDGY